jgi:hypothetical protein
MSNQSTRSLSPAASPNPETTSNSIQCTLDATSGRSPAARAYIDAVNRAIPRWQKVSDTLAAEGYVTHREDLLAQGQADASFLADLRRISFPADNRPLSNNLISWIEQYDAFLTTASQQHGYRAAHQQQDDILNNGRASASALLRLTLGLPQSNCASNRP